MVPRAFAWGLNGGMHVQDFCDAADLQRRHRRPQKGAAALDALGQDDAPPSSLGHHPQQLHLPLRVLRGHDLAADLLRQGCLSLLVSIAAPSLECRLQV